MARTKGSLGKKTLINMGQSIVKPIKKESTGKRGRPKKEKTFNNVGIIMAEVKIKKNERENYQTDIPRVEKLNQLSGQYRHMISGENYNDAVKQAKIIMAELGYKIINYFEQYAFSKSIIIGYNKV